MSLKGEMTRFLETKRQEIHRKLIVESISGNEKARFKLYSLYSSAMFNVCLRMLNSREDAEDVLQDSFAEIFYKLDSFRFESTFGAWVKRIVVNKCMNFLRKNKIGLLFNDEIIQTVVNSEEEIDYTGISFKVDKIKKTIGQLPEGYRVILNLYLFEGYDHTEIAGILNISESTSKTQYLRAKLRIRDILKNEL